MTSGTFDGGYDVEPWSAPDDWNLYHHAHVQSSSKSSFRLSPDHSLKPQLIVVRQPEEQHRARYLSEGSRGAIKDRSGTSYCTIQLIGYYRPTRVEVYAGSCSGSGEAHQLYELIPVSGKGSATTPCKKVIAQDGIHCLEVVLRPENNMIAVLDCVGILKICSYDGRRRMAKNSGNNCAVRLVFRTYLTFENGTETIIETKTEPIRCVQQLGVPEVLKMSLTTASAKGGEELFIIGRNFDRNTSVILREYKEDGMLLWNAEAQMQRQYCHQCHIVCTVPQYHNVERGGTVSLTIRCGQKSSHPISFHYKPYDEETDKWKSSESSNYCNKLDKNYSDTTNIPDSSGTIDCNYTKAKQSSSSSSSSPMYQYLSSGCLVDEVAVTPKRSRMDILTDNSCL